MVMKLDINIKSKRVAKIDLDDQFLTFELHGSCGALLRKALYNYPVVYYHSVWRKRDGATRGCAW